MVIKTRIFLICAIALGSSLCVGAWLLLTGSGALWCLEQLNGPDLRVEVARLEGSILAGAEVRDLQVAWSSGSLEVDRLEFAWSPTALLQRRLEIVSIAAGTIQLSLPDSDPQEKVAQPDPGILSSLTEAFFVVPEHWQVSLQGLTADALAIQKAGRPNIHLEEIAFRLGMDSTRAHFAEGGLDGDWGSWRADLTLVRENMNLSGELSWQPPQPLGPIESLEVELSLSSTKAGTVQGPVTLVGQREKGRYRLAGGLELGLEGLRLRNLQLDRGDSGEEGNVTGELRLDWQQDFSWSTEVDLTALNLETELGQKTSLQGELRLGGEATSFGGDIDLKNLGEGWRDAALRARLDGDSAGLRLNQIQAVLLKGDVQGTLELGWGDTLTSRFALKAVGLDPESLPSGPAGKIDLLAEGSFRQTSQGPILEGRLNIERGELMGRELRGQAVANWQGGRRLKIERLELEGGWGHLAASGQLEHHLELRLQLDEAGTLCPGLSGHGSLDGWLAWPEAWPRGSMHGKFQEIAYQNWSLGELEIKTEPAVDEQAAALRLALVDLQKNDEGLDRLQLTVYGAPEAHELRIGMQDDLGTADLFIQGQWRDNRWQAKLQEVKFESELIETFVLERPVVLGFEPGYFHLGDLRLTGSKGGSLNLSGQWRQHQKRASLVSSWQQFELSLLSFWLPDLHLGGLSSGQLTFDRAADGGISGQLQADYRGQLGYAGQNLQIEQARVAARLDKTGVKGEAELHEKNGGQLRLTVSPTNKLNPFEEDFLLELQKIPLKLLNAQLPTGAEMQGLLEGQIAGHWRADKHFSLEGFASIQQGVFRFHSENSQLRLALQKARVEFQWKEQLAVNLLLRLNEKDLLRGDVRVRLPGRWPLSEIAAASLDGAIDAHLERLDLLTLVVPDLLSDIGGQIDVGLTLGGALADPEFKGSLSFLQGRAELPRLGIKLTDVEVQASFVPPRLRLDQISMRSGPGQLQGKGEVHFAGWKPRQFEAQLKGEQVLIANLPEIRAMASPDLRLSGDNEGISLQGSLTIPELQIINWHPVGQVSRTDDLVYIDDLPKPEEREPLATNVDIRVALGEEVAIKDSGLDVRLGGQVRLLKSSGGQTTAQGQIDVPEGNYDAYGVKLPITSGRLIFSGGPVDNPALDITAAKKVDDVTAGVAVGGTARQPKLSLFSDPTLDDADILSYMIFGHEASSGPGSLSALSLAAGALLSSGDSASLQQQLFAKSGVDVIDLETGEGETLEESVVTVGKYLTPELYLSYGRSLSGSSNQIQLRYSPNDRVDIESQLGEVSGADLYYKLDFN